jgi:outer membrane murein-binding lipoprotein Lpp
MDMSFLWRAENGETPKIGRIKSLIAEAEIDQATQAEAHLGSKHAQLETELAMVNSELQAVKRENVELRLQEVHVQALTEHAEVIFIPRLSGPHSHAPPHSTAIPKNLAPQLVL